MLKRVVVVTAIFTFLIYSSISFAEEKAGIVKKLTDLKNKIFAKKEAVPAVKEKAKPAVSEPAPNLPLPKKTYSKEEMTARIKNILDTEEELLNFIPGLKKAATEKGESFYTYEGLKLEELDKKKLSKIFTRVRQEATRIRTSRLNSQLENIRRNQQLTAAAGGGAPRVPVMPPQPPRVYTPPSIPPAPPSVPQPPRAPAQPPAPPRR